MTMMEVILLERIPSLGQMGEVVRVRPGYARNYLLPQKKALRATDANKKFFESRRVELEATNLARRQEAEKVAAKLDKQSFTIIRQAAEGGQLYGSVASRDVADAVIAGGFKIARQQVVLNQAIKTLGLFPVPIALHPEVTVTVTINVARTEDEAKVQQEKGAAVIVTRAEIEADQPTFSGEAAQDGGEPQA
jgi:large subunit ribosomal protein L9